MEHHTRGLEYDFTFKIMLLGDGGVGKTALLSRYVDGIFEEPRYQMTIGVDFKIKKLLDFENSDGLKYNIRLQIWDLGGQDWFKPIRDPYYRGASGGILVYDITRYSTYKNLKDWLKEMFSNVEPSNDKVYVPVVLIGNKCDLEEKRSVSSKDARKFAKENNFVFYETSAKTGVNVDDVFRVLTKAIMDRLS